MINVTPRSSIKKSPSPRWRGIPVLSEKPLADTFEAAQAIVDKANATGVLHMITQNYRYRSATQTLKQTLASKAMGEIGRRRWNSSADRISAASARRCHTR